jgi:preprotein translocase subunit SecF
VTEVKRSIWHRLYHGETAIDFVGSKNRWFILSGAVILIGIISLFVQGLNFGIDFKGGTAWEVPTKTASVAAARDAVRPFGLADAQIQVITNEQGRFIKVSADIKGSSDKATQTKQQVTDALAKMGKVSSNQVTFTDVGPSWGHEITKKAERALVVFFVLIIGYISIRFEWKMAAAAVIAVIHDILVTVGVYSIAGFPVTPATVIAFLTILGYSLYDTIVVFDKVRENSVGLGATGRMTYSDVVNLSMNQVLMRSLNTSLVAILPVLSVLIIGAYILGARALQDFGLALSVGLLTGAYSSIFVASPLLAMFKERETRYSQIRNKLASRATSAPLTPAAAAASGLTTDLPTRREAAEADDDGPPLKPSSGVAQPVAAGARSGGANRPRPGGNRPPPRPRKKGRRR